ncbi:MAG: Holliday junction resolvase RecU [Bacilli bacterium]
MKYPQGIIKVNRNYYSHSNRGMTLESDINITNKYYLDNDIACIYKKPTPITVARVDYPNRKDAVITEAYYKTPSTTDYNGIYNGKYIDFEVKEIKLNFFPLSNIHNHQINHLKIIINYGGIGFIIVKFSLHDKIFLLEGEKLFSFIKNNTRKSIPLEYFEMEGYIIKEQYNPRVDYLNIINKIYFEGE